MAEPTLTDVFGAGATQSATTVTILKSDLDLIATASNKAEGLYAALVKKASVNLTKTAFDADADRNVYIAPYYDSLVQRTIANVTTPLYVTSWTNNFAKPQASPGITPNDY